MRLLDWMVHALRIAGTGFLACLVAGPGHAQRGYESDEKDPLKLSLQLQAPQGLYPGIVAIERFHGRSGWNKHCSGVLVKPDWVLTQAYCAAELRPADLRVLFGNADLRKAATAEVAEVVIHEDYRAQPTPENSLALIRLRGGIPVEPPTVAREALGSLLGRQGDTGGAVAVGWGSFFASEPGDRMHLQRHLSVRPISLADCQGIFGDYIKPGVVCAFSGFNNIDVCMGFAGGPLMIPDARGRFRLLGLVSWAEGCAKPNRPTVYTHVAHYVPWIEGKVGRLPADATTPPPAAPRTTTAALPLPDKQFAGRIVGPNANVAPAGLFRYMVSIGEAKKNQALGHFCGGVLVSRRWVLTAAHCVSDAGKTLPPASLQLKMDTEVLSSGGVLLQARRIIVHESYHATAQGDLKYDIALIEIDGDVPRDVALPAIADLTTERGLLGDAGDDPKDVVVIGWGKNAFSRFGKISNHLHWTTVQMVRRQDCNSSTSYGGRIDASVYCAGKEDVDSCEGDSGGPMLVTDRNLNFVVVGVVSWGEGCGKTNKPGVYTRVPVFLDWIKANMN